MLRCNSPEWLGHSLHTSVQTCRSNPSCRRLFHPFHENLHTINKNNRFYTIHEDNYYSNVRIMERTISSESKSQGNDEITFWAKEGSTLSTEEVFWMPGPVQRRHNFLNRHDNTYCSRPKVNLNSTVTNGDSSDSHPVWARCSSSSVGRTGYGNPSHSRAVHHAQRSSWSRSPLDSVCTQSVQGAMCGPWQSPP